jgi:hypothetical protein
MLVPGIAQRTEQILNNAHRFKHFLPKTLCVFSVQKAF